MAIKSYKMGPGTLKFGAGLATDASCQVRACRVDWAESVTEEEDIDVLCGETLEGEDTATYDATLVFTVLQDIDSADFVTWTWTNKGTAQLVEFVPSTDEARKVTGTVRVVPLSIGGDVKARNTADASWAFTVDPVLGDVA